MEKIGIGRNWVRYATLSEGKKAGIDFPSSPARTKPKPFGSGFTFVGNRICFVAFYTSAFSR